jgi:hypothetical protein
VVRRSTCPSLTETARTANLEAGPASIRRTRPEQIDEIADVLDPRHQAAGRAGEAMSRAR